MMMMLMMAAPELEEPYWGHPAALGQRTLHGCTWARRPGQQPAAAGIGCRGRLSAA
jgi:hypothetical protein